MTTNTWKTEDAPNLMEDTPETPEYLRGVCAKCKVRMTRELNAKLIPCYAHDRQGCIAWVDDIGCVNNEESEDAEDCERCGTIVDHTLDGGKNEVELQAGCGASHRYSYETLGILVPKRLQDYITLELKLAEGQYTTINIGTGVVEELARTVKDMVTRGGK